MELWSAIKGEGFVWKLEQNRIPTVKNLANRGVVVQNGMCKGCNKVEETVDHLFFKCEIFSALWTECLRWWGIQAPLQVE